MIPTHPFSCPRLRPATAIQSSVSYGKRSCAFTSGVAIYTPRTSIARATFFFRPSPNCSVDPRTTQTPASGGAAPGGICRATVPGRRIFCADEAMAWKRLSASSSCSPVAAIGTPWRYSTHRGGISAFPGSLYSLSFLVVSSNQTNASCVPGIGWTRSSGLFGFSERHEYSRSLSSTARCWRAAGTPLALPLSENCLSISSESGAARSQLSSTSDGPSSRSTPSAGLLAPSSRALAPISNSGVCFAERSPSFRALRQRVTLRAVPLGGRLRGYRCHLSPLPTPSTRNTPAGTGVKSCSRRVSACGNLPAAARASLPRRTEGALGPKGHPCPRSWRSAACPAPLGWKASFRGRIYPNGVGRALGLLKTSSLNAGLPCGSFFQSRGCPSSNRGTLCLIQRRSIDRRGPTVPSTYFSRPSWAACRSFSTAFQEASSLAVGSEVFPRVRDGRRTLVSHGRTILGPFSGPDLDNSGDLLLRTRNPEGPHGTHPLTSRQTRRNSPLPPTGTDGPTDEARDGHLSARRDNRPSRAWLHHRGHRRGSRRGGFRDRAQHAEAISLTAQKPSKSPPGPPASSNDVERGITQLTTCPRSLGAPRLRDVGCK